MTTTTLTLKDHVQQFCEIRGLPVPATVYGSADVQVKQMVRLLQRGCEDLSGRGKWEELTNEALWTTLNSETQGTLASLAPNGFRYIIPETLWDRTQKLPLLGPVSSQRWQFLKAIVITGPRYSFRLRGGNFMVTPAPPAGHTWAFEYITENWLQHVDTTFGKLFTADTDIILLPDQIVAADLEWRWLRAKGLSYAEEFNSAERLIVDALGRDGPKPVLWMDFNGERNIEPGIFIPSGTWMQP